MKKEVQRLTFEAIGRTGAFQNQTLFVEALSFDSMEQSRESWKFAFECAQTTNAELRAALRDILKHSDCCCPRCKEISYDDFFLLPICSQKPKGCAL